MAIESTRTVESLTEEEIGILFAERCLRPRHRDWVLRVAHDPVHPSVSRVIELSVCAQYQADDVKGGLHAGGSTIKAKDFQGA